MENSLFLFIAFLIPFSALTFYLGFIRSRDIIWPWKAQTACVASIALIIVCVLLLWKQSGAVDRLAETGVVPYPAIRNVVGAAYGDGDNPNWLFDADASTDEVRNFYLDEANRPGWELTDAENSLMLFFRKGDRKMIISFCENRDCLTLGYRMTKVGEP